MTKKSLKVLVLNEGGKVVGEEAVNLALPQEPSWQLVSQAVGAFLANQRKARAKVKTRSLVNGSKSKIWRQKGTGRARHGDRQAPIFVGGGVAHGPTGLQNYAKKFNRKMVRQALFSVLLHKLQEKKLYLFEPVKMTKTKEAADFMAQVKQTSGQSKIAFILAGEKEVRRALRNLAEVEVFDLGSLNVYHLLNTNLLLVSRLAWQKLTENYGNKH